MSAHDRGAFGALLVEAKELGEQYLTFTVDLDAEDEEPSRWLLCGEATYAEGRTGEEALRSYVDQLRVARRPDGA